MEIKTVVLTALQANCYLISGENAAVAIDPGEYSDTVAEFLRNNSSKERLIVLTHAHFDHIGGAARLRAETGVPIAIGEKDAAALADSNVNLSAAFGFPLEPFNADRALRDGEQLSVGDLSFKIIETPGHTVGSICLLANDTLFTGDTLFCRSVGRTDFPGGSTADLLSSIKNKITALPDDTVILSGHGNETTVGAERLFNPYLGGDIYEFM